MLKSFIAISLIVQISTTASVLEQDKQELEAERAANANSTSIRSSNWRKPNRRS